MGKLFLRLIGIKTLIRFAEAEVGTIAAPELTVLVAEGLARISDGHLPTTAKELRDIATALEAKDRAGAAKIIVASIEEAKA